MDSHVVSVEQPRRTIWAAALGTVGFAAIFAASLDWAKWTPYLHKLEKIHRTGVWPGSDILAKAGAAHTSPSPHGAWTFTVAYLNAIWPALVAALLISAAIETLVPRRWFLRVLCRTSHAGGSLVGGVLALPSLMCTCCTAPVAATLRRNGAPTSAVLAYWLGNPLLNPAVLAFLALVAPWQWVTTRIIGGAVLVFVASALIARFVGGRTRPVEVDLEALPAFRLAEAPRRYLLSLARLCATLLPEYAVVVFLLGLFRGWIFPFDGSARHWGILALVVAALLGTLVVIPTGGEIPIVQGLAAAGGGSVGPGRASDRVAGHQPRLDGDGRARALTACHRRCRGRCRDHQRRGRSVTRGARQMRLSAAATSSSSAL